MSLLKTSSPGVGIASSGGTPASVGHSYAFGNTEEKARRLNLGCKARGQPGQPFSHKTGHGYVKAHRGFYHDAIFVKRNNFNLNRACRFSTPVEICRRGKKRPISVSYTHLTLPTICSV